MLEMVRDDVHHFELLRLPAPHLTETCAAGSTFVRRSIEGVEDCHASKVRVPNRITVAEKVVECRVNYDLKVSSKGFHISYTFGRNRAPLLLPDAERELELGHAPHSVRGRAENTPQRLGALADRRATHSARPDNPESNAGP